MPWDLLWILAILLLALCGWIYFHILIAQEKGGYVQIETTPQYSNGRDSRDSSRENSRENRERENLRGNFSDGGGGPSRY